MAKNERNADVFSTILKKNVNLNGTGYNDEINITTLPELKLYIPPLANDEFFQLEANILAEGCREALIIWQYDNQYILVDGHNRYEICTKHNLPFKTDIKYFTDIEAVKDWMINNQLGKRNVTEEVKSYLRGCQYANEKQKYGTNQYTKSGVDKLSTPQRTSERLARQHKVSNKTIERDEKFVKNLEIFVENDTNLKWKILNKELLISKTDLEKLAKYPAKERDVIKGKWINSGKIELYKNMQNVDFDFKPLLKELKKALKDKNKLKIEEIFDEIIKQNFDV